MHGWIQTDSTIGMAGAGDWKQLVEYTCEGRVTAEQKIGRRRRERVAWRRCRKAGIVVTKKQKQNCPCPLMEVAVSQRYLSPSRVRPTKNETKQRQGDKKKKRCGVKRGRGRDSKKKNWGNEVLVEREGVNLSVADKIGQCLTLVYTHVLPEVIVTAKVLSASFDGTLVRLLVCVDRSHMPLQMLTASKALVAPVDGAPVHPHVLLHTALHDEHRSRWHTAPARLFL